MLKPCPFCGGMAEIRETHIYQDEAIIVKCVKCFATTALVFIDNPKHMRDNLDKTPRFTFWDAINETERLWNRAPIRNCSA